MLQKIKGYHLMVVLSVSWASTPDRLGLCAKKPVQEPAEPPGLDPLKQVGNIVLD
jgi:hypothetical protein